MLVTHLPKLALLTQIGQNNVSDDTQAYEIPEQSEELDGNFLGSCFLRQASACHSPSQGSKVQASDKRADFITTMPMRKLRHRKPPRAYSPSQYLPGIWDVTAYFPLCGSRV